MVAKALSITLIAIMATNNPTKNPIMVIITIYIHKYLMNTIENLTKYMCLHSASEDNAENQVSAAASAITYPKIPVIQPIQAQICVIDIN